MTARFAKLTPWLVPLLDHHSRPPQHLMPLMILSVCVSYLEM